MNAILVFCASFTNRLMFEFVCENVKSVLFESVGLAVCAGSLCENMPATEIAIVVVNVLLPLVLSSGLSFR